MIPDRSRQAAGSPSASCCRTAYRGLWLAGLVWLLAGCGLQLRGSGESAGQLQALDVSATNAYGQLVRVMRQTLASRGVVVDPADGAAYQLQLLGERAIRRAVSTTSQISVAEYVLRLEVDFELFDQAGASIMPLSTISAERIYSFDRSNFGGSSEEEVLLNQEMQVDIVQQIIRRAEVAAARSRP